MDPAELKQRLDLMEDQLTSRNAELVAAEHALSQQTLELGRLRTGNSEAMDALDRAETHKHKYKAVKLELQDERQRRMQGEKETASLQAKLANCEEEMQEKARSADNQLRGLREMYDARMKDLQESFSREQMAREEAEKVREAAAKESMSSRHNLREEICRREALEKDRKALELRTKTLEAEVVSAGKRVEGLQEHVVEKERLKQKLRSCNEHAKDLADRLKNTLARLDVEKESRSAAEVTLKQQTTHFESLHQEAQKVCQGRSGAHEKRVQRHFARMAGVQGAAPSSPGGPKSLSGEGAGVAGAA